MCFSDPQNALRIIVYIDTPYDFAYDDAANLDEWGLQLSMFLPLSLSNDLQHHDAVTLAAALSGFIIYTENRFLAFRKACLLFRYSAECLTTNKFGSLLYSMNDKGP